MNIIEPGIRNLALAKDILLTPYGLDESLLTRTIADIFTHRVDYADLYFQATRSEAWSLEEGIVKSGSFSIDQASACARSRATAPRSHIPTTCRRKRSRKPRPPPRQSRRPGRPPEDQGGIVAEGHLGPRPVPAVRSARVARRDGQIKLLERIEQMARGRDPRITQVMAGLAGEYDVVLVARSDGALAADIRPLVRVSVTVIAEQNGRREIGSGGGGGRFDYGYFTDDVLSRYVDDAVHAALVNLDARPRRPAR